jgi:hypothetical protein
VKREKGEGWKIVGITQPAGCAAAILGWTETSATTDAMRRDLMPNYRRTTELEADAMINEGGAIRQPSLEEAEAAFAHVNPPCGGRSNQWREWLDNPTAMFWTGFATGLALSLLEKHPDGKT